MLIGKVPLFSVTTRCTRSVGASWAIQHQFSSAKVCKAASWSLDHTFTKFHQVDVRDTGDPTSAY